MTGDRSGEREKEEVQGRAKLGDVRAEGENPSSRRSLSGERVSDNSLVDELCGVCPVERGGENELEVGLRTEERRGEEL